MFKRILIPLDLTDKHQPVLNMAGEMAGQSGGEVILLHVIESIPGLPAEELAGFYRRLEKSAREHLQRSGQQLGKEQVSWTSEVLIGPRVQEIVRYAAEVDADLILVTAPRLDPDHAGAGWASLSWKIGLLAPCPVLLVR
jgi:nucleotide-binding universal stress UspA family protein